MPIARINWLLMFWVGKIFLGVDWEDTVLWLGDKKMFRLQRNSINNTLIIL